jgi:hypothetical protein
MGKLEPQRTVVIVFDLALPKAMRIALAPRRSKVIGSPIPTPRTIYLVASGNAEAANQ